MSFRNPYIILTIFILFIVFFGAKRLPDSARSLGRSMRIFKTELKEMNTEEKNGDDEDKSGK